MSDLREVMSELGFGGVRTLLQSGNIIFDSKAAPDVAKLESAVAERTGVHARIMVLNADRFERIVADFPFSEVATDDSKALITFVDSMPSAASVARLSAEELAPEQLVLGKDAIYQWLPEGVLATKLPARFSKQFGENATARNLRTARKIVALLDD
jgi:uncharacterized protein (DUF1697 family)